jgi:hypothetical protein
MVAKLTVTDVGYYLSCYTVGTVKLAVLALLVFPGTYAIVTVPLLIVTFAVGYILIPKRNNLADVKRAACAP